MADIQNIPIEQPNSNSIKALAQEDASRSARLNDAIKEKQNAEPESIEDRVEITPNALKQSEALEQSRGGSQPQTLRTNRLAEKTYAQDGSAAQSVTEQRRDASKAVKEGFQRGSVQIQPVVTDQVRATSVDEQRLESSAALEAGFEAGNTQTDPTAMQKFSTRKQETAGAQSVVQQRIEMKEAMAENKPDAAAVETERGQNVSNLI